MSSRPSAQTQNANTAADEMLCVLLKRMCSQPRLYTWKKAITMENYFFKKRKSTLFARNNDKAPRARFFSE